MKNERLIYSIGEISDQYVREAAAAEVQPRKSRIMPTFRKSTITAAALAICFMVSALAVYIITGDVWIQSPSNDPAEAVRAAIENQVGKNYTLAIDVKSVTIDEAETTRVVERFIKGTIAGRRGWSDEYLADHFVVVKAAYYAKYDPAQTTRSDGDVIQYFYLAQDVNSGEWTIIDNSGNVNWSEDTSGVDAAEQSAPVKASSIREQLFSHLSELYTVTYAPYYDGLHYEISNYEETVCENNAIATFQWTYYFLGKCWDVTSDEGVEQQANIFLQATVAVNGDGTLDFSTLSVLADSSATGPANYNIPLEDYFPNQLSD